jgi:hypothetical protein
VEAGGLFVTSVLISSVGTTGLVDGEVHPTSVLNNTRITIACIPEYEFPTNIIYRLSRVSPEIINYPFTA